MVETSTPQNSPEYQWLVLCLGAPDDPAAVENLRAMADSAEINWGALVERSVKEQVSTLVYDLTAGKDMLPPAIEDRLRQKYYYNARRNTLLLEELGEILLDLQRAGAASLPLKGAALAEGAYANPALRPMADLDLLVHPDEAAAAHSVLTALGYTLTALEPWPGFNQRYRQVLEYHKPVQDSSSILLDLHLGLVDLPIYRRIPLQELFQRAGRATLANVETSIPAPEDQLLILCAHLGLHERYQGTLMRYYDLAVLIRQAGANFAWRQVLERAISWQLVIPLQRSLTHLGQLWPGIAPVNVSRQVDDLTPTKSEKRLHNWVIDRTRNPSADVLLTAATLPGLSRKAMYLLEQAFPSPGYMRKLYFRGHPQLWPLAYLLRAGLTFRYLFRGKRLDAHNSTNA
jgi:hypothetical protein